MQSPNFVSALRRSLSLHIPESAVKRSASPTLSPAHHGLASEARSTGCRPNEPRSKVKRDRFNSSPQSRAEIG
jgi:hypothetical protein